MHSEHIHPLDNEVYDECCGGLANNELATLLKLSYAVLNDLLRREVIRHSGKQGGKKYSNNLFHTLWF